MTDKYIKRFTYAEAKKIVNDLGFELISREYFNSHQKLTLKDKEGYLYTIRLMNLKQGKLPNRFSNRNPNTIYNIKLWLKYNNKPFELISNEYINSGDKLKWKCLIDGCQETFETPWEGILNGANCGYCFGRRVGLSNCLATLNPELAKEWHPTKNGNLTPYDVTCGTNKTIWWKCKKGHEWEADISSRAKNGCPYCSHSLPSEDYNLLIINPNLCEEWNYSKNNKLPEEYCPSSHDYAWWKCKECNHEWRAIIGNRHRIESGCPSCAESKGEKEITNVLVGNDWIKICQEEYDILDNKCKNSFKYFIPQKSFYDLIGLGGGLLSYDFYLPKFNLLIEYQGEYHDGTVKNQTLEEFEYQKEHDRRKKEYAQQNEYNFLEIWYWDKDNIRKILEKMEIL